MRNSANRLPVQNFAEYTTLLPDAGPFAQPIGPSVTRKI
jgi:hypothetical protein